MKRTALSTMITAAFLLAACGQQVRAPAPEPLLAGDALAASAAPTELFFSEYVEGSSNNKALEIFNGTDAVINLTADGYNVQMFFNGNASAGLTINLVGTVAAGDVFVLANASASAAILAQADQTNGASWYNGDDAVALRKGTTVIDVIGQIGFDPGSEWGTGLTSTADNTLRRLSSVCTGDPDGSDAFDPSLEWAGFAQDTSDGLGTHVADCAPGSDLAPTVLDTVPADGAVDVDPEAPLVVTFSEAVAQSDAFSLSCALAGAPGPVEFSVSGGPTAYTIQPAAKLEPGATCTLTIAAAGITDLDGDPDAMEADFSVGFTVGEVVDVCAAAFTPIYEIQGNGAATPLAGQTVTTQGVVVGDFEGPSPTLRGFYLQDPDGDGDLETSDGIFVFNANRDSVNVGELVRVEGTASEFSGMTQISAAAIVACGTGSVQPTPVTLPVTSLSDFERYEGMLVTFPQDLVISEYFNFDRFGEIVLALPPTGLDRPFQATSYVEPAVAAAVTAANALARITLDDARTSQNPTPAIHPNDDPFTLNNRFRGGDRVTGAVGILDYRFNLYRLQPVGPVPYAAANLRTPTPDDVGGDILVAAFNVLNYFSTLDLGPDICGPLGDQECRGADNEDEFERQRSKIIAALAAIDADVVGLIEIENGGNALADLVSGLNDELGVGAYAGIETGPIGPDAIRVALIYQPARVTPVGAFAVLDTPEFLDPLGSGSALNRPALAQTFASVADGGAVTVVVNHLKSKGSACGPGDDDPIQGNCNLTRTAAVERLLEWIASDPTGAQDPDVLLIGDYNAYDEEDPIATLAVGGFTDLLERYQGEFAYTYVFDGQFGHLDYALSSPTLTAQVTGTTAWAINADEPDILDYDTSFKQPAEDALFAPDPYRSSDHDPVIVGLDLNAAPVCSDAMASVTSLWPANHRLVSASVLGVTDPEGDAIQIVIDAIYQDEPVNDDDDGNTMPDGVIGSGNAFEVRAERSGEGDGRVYHVIFTALDATGSCSGEVLIGVPLNQRRGGVAVDGGALYDSTAY